MELKEFAETILFGTDLSSDKLLNPIILTDNSPGKEFIAPKLPGRPSNLKFFNEEIHKKVQFPNLNQLERIEKRGHILHFFANHELLALEIMALVLLLFPNAPQKFRMGVAQTMFDEQKHLKLYLKRMNELNVQFGDIPVNDFFWNCLSKIKTPFDFVTQMSLTFEQANLDYAKFYMNIMKTIEDTITHNILESVYLDEIQHVKHGLTWFNIWKNQELSEWEAYITSLNLPLTPMRAKGKVFDRESRILAGFSNNFINELSVYSSSKGRPPNIYYFNPSCEQEIVHGKIGFTPVKSIAELTEDYSFLTSFLTHTDDIALVTQKPSIQFLDKIQSAGFSLPEFFVYSQNNICYEKLAQNYVGSLNPWGWSPQSISSLSGFKEKVIFKTDFERNILDLNFFVTNIKKLFSKSYSASLMPNIINSFDSYKDLIPPKEVLPQVCYSLEDIIYYVQKTKLFINNNNFVLKAPFGTAGSNFLKFNSEFSTNEIKWIKRILREQAEIIIEPWFDKCLDISCLFKIHNNHAIILGTTNFFTNNKGQYKGTFVGKKNPLLSSELSKFVYNNNILELLKEVSISISKNIIETTYEGPIGIDAFIYKDPNSIHGFRLKPLSEINPRYTMGRVALELSKRISPGAFALWLHVTRLEILANGYESIQNFADIIENKFSIEINCTGKNLIKNGILFTNDPKISKFALTLLIVGEKTCKEFTQLTGIKTDYL